MINKDWQNFTPQQRLLWNYASSLIAYNTITPLYYQGAIAGSEFLIYAATKLYIALDVKFGGGTYGIGVIPSITTSDEADGVNGYFTNVSAFYDSVLPDYIFAGKTLVVNNIFFSRFAAFDYTHMVFNGYRLSIV